MEDDLKRQASKLYKEHSQQEDIPTSDSLSMKKIIYVSLGILMALSVLIYSLGGSNKRTDPVAAAVAPRTVAKEPFPPEAPAPAPTSPAQAGQAEIKSPEAPAASPQSEPPPNPARHKPAEPTSSAGETSRRVDIPDTQEKGRHARNSSAPGQSVHAPGGGRVAESRPAPATVPEVSPLEVARQELARDIVLEKSSSMAGLINSPGDNLDYQGWKASTDGTDDYQVVFSFREKTSGATVQYIWRVNITGRTITPQSYYARKLS